MQVFGHDIDQILATLKMEEELSRENIKRLRFNEQNARANLKFRLLVDDITRDRNTIMHEQEDIFNQFKELELMERHKPAEPQHSPEVQPLIHHHYSAPTQEFKSLHGRTIPPSQGRPQLPIYLPTYGSTPSLDHIYLPYLELSLLTSLRRQPQLTNRFLTMR